MQGSLLVHAEAALGHIEQRPAPRGSSAASSRPLLDRLFTAGSGSQAGAMPPAASSEGSSSSSGDSSSSSGGGGGGYSQPCDFSAPPSCEGGAMEARLVFSQRCGRLRLHNVRVANRGVDWGHADNVWWRHSLVRHEACRVLLRGMSGEWAGGCSLRAAAWWVASKHRWSFLKHWPPAAYCCQPLPHKHGMLPNYLLQSLRCGTSPCRAT